MGKKSAKKSSKRGYGVHNVARKDISKRHIKGLLRKKWSLVTSMDLYTLYNEGYSTAELVKTYDTSSIAIINRLRFL
ncbi:hypothetical protein DID76_02915 [Candidatus Marinamargulisbacteria bacterium SCGC AG-414-C22]|nr:hypothetical protein DID76_02915 [Candidatus Marinamargulisbacteria bacterium SCGC AG-414-C22]